MNSQELFGIFVVPAIIGLVEVCKDLGLPTKAAPALSVLFGVLAALAQLFSGQWPWIQAAVCGIALGLSACGLYAGVKTVLPIPQPSNPIPHTPNPTPTNDTNGAPAA
jgi:hypothetical protein